MSNQTTPQQQLNRETVDIPYRHVTTLHRRHLAWKDSDKTPSKSPTQQPTPSGFSTVGNQNDVNAPGDFPSCPTDRKSTRLNSSHVSISYAVFCLKKKKEQ